ncbi:hypothetical protein BDF22DRAFT_661798 [Syncephalis plumigaleata]|nr:hypothetical protein BDF22DRAFT_661798 [Syncephalis plumigaleata]
MTSNLLFVYLPKLCLILCFISRILPATGSIEIISDADVKQRYSTHDPTEVRSDFFNTTGLLIQPRFTSTEACELDADQMILPTSANRSQLEGMDASIGIVDHYDAKSHGCTSLEQISKTLVRYNEQLARNGIPAVQVILYVLLSNESDVYVFAGATMFNSPFLSIPSGNPSLPVAVLSRKTSSKFTSRFNSLPQPIIARIIQEPEPWNNFVFSTLYGVLVWVFFALNVIIALRAIGNLLFIITSGAFKSELRTLAFSIALFSVILALTALPLKSILLSTQLLYQTSTILFCISFYIVLLIWCSFHSLIYVGNHSRIMRIMVHASFLLQIVGEVTIFVCYFITKTVLTFRIYSVLVYAIIVLQIMTAQLFVYSGIMFYMKTRSCTNTAAKDALLKLALISFVSFAYFMLIGIERILALDFEWGHLAVKIITRKIFKLVGFTVESWILLYLLGIRMPNESTAHSIM